MNQSINTLDTLLERIHLRNLFLTVEPKSTADLIALKQTSLEVGNRVIFEVSDRSAPNPKIAMRVFSTDGDEIYSTNAQKIGFQDKDNKSILSFVFSPPKSGKLSYQMSISFWEIESPDERKWLSFEFSLINNSDDAVGGEGGGDGSGAGGGDCCNRN